MPAKMTSEDFGQYWIIGKVPSALLHIGAVNAEKFAEIQKTGIPGPAPHSPEWAPDREPTLKGAIRAEVTELIQGYAIANLGPLGFAAVALGLQDIERKE